MKRLHPFLTIGVVLALVLLFPINGYPGSKTWVLYDDFNSGFIDTDLWEVDQSSATISIEGGRAKFEHEPGHPFVSSWLNFKKRVKKIGGIRATITVQSCTGDVRGRIGGFIGKVGDDYVFHRFPLVAANEWILGAVSVLDGGTYDFLYDLCTGIFEYPIDIIETSYTVTSTFSLKKVTYEVNGLGSIVFKAPEKLSPTDVHSKGIGTLSLNGDGPCVVYFDDVYVLVPP